MKNLTTFGLSAKCRVFRIQNIVNLSDYFKEYGFDNYFVLGAGSNIIVSPNIESQNILKIEIMGKEIVHEENGIVYLKVGAGEIWDDVVLYAVNNNLSGIEALSAIPGTAGATPVQNVGAYGVEIKDVLESLTAYDTKNQKFITIKNSECNFSYRNSIFKSSQKGQYIIIDILLKLKREDPKIPDYGSVKEYFSEKGIINPSLLDIRNSITEIRWSKLPHPEEMGNCGSFFENPIVQKSLADNLKEKFPEMPIYPVDENSVKLSAGFLIEKAGLKGYSFGNVSTYDKNALVLVNNGEATSQDVLSAKNQIIKKVKDDFGVELSSEPQFI